MTAAPDLVITEFSNDVTMDVDAARESYQELADLFGSIGIEWAILSPGYVRPGPRSPCSFWMMGFGSFCDFSASRSGEGTYQDRYGAWPLRPLFGRWG